MISILNGHGATESNRLDTAPGGLMVGPGNLIDDQILVTLPAGAFVLNAEATLAAGPHLLQELVDRATAVALKGRLSLFEFVVPPAARSAIGSEFLSRLNGIGSELQRGCEDPAALEREAKVMMRDAIARVSLLIEDPDDPEVVAFIESRFGRCEEPILAASGVDLGALVGGFARTSMALDDHKQAQERWAADNQRAQESHAQTIARNGIALDAAKRRAAEDDSAAQHFDNWRDGIQKMDAGDYSTFAGTIGEYNKNEGAFNDGYKLIPQSTPKGVVLNHVDADGNVHAQYSKDDAKTLYNTAMAKKLSMLSPRHWEAAQKAALAAEEKRADRESRERIAGTHADARMYGADVRADTAEEVAGIRAGATTEAARLRASAPRAGGGLTLSQQRANDEIDAARAMIDGLTPEEIKRRTSKATDTGRDNPEYDGSLSHAVSLARRLKFGEAAPDRGRASISALPTDMHDVLQGNAIPDSATRQANKLTPKQSAEAAMAADQSMAGYTLGEQTGRGFKVLDKDGRHVGYFGR